MSLLVTGIFTLTPTHCGTGQAAGAVDLPIAREAHTGLPLMPATTLKGVARDGWFELPAEDVVRLFGPSPPNRARNNGDDVAAGGARQPPAERAEDESVSALSAGDLVFLDGMLLCFPVRSLTGGFRLVTSPLLLDRLRRIARSHNKQLAAEFSCPRPAADEVILPPGQAGPLSLEDVVFRRQKCQTDPAVATLAGALGRLVSSDATDADRTAMPQRLVVVADEVLQDLTRRATSVSARIVLSEKKTSTNLWYEETLPPDCLFAAAIAQRPGARKDPLDQLAKHLGPEDRYTQIGGNATVGQGQCRWVLKPMPGVGT